MLEVVAIRPVRILEKYELERRLVDGEVRVTRTGLGRTCIEHLRVEVDRSIEVTDVEGELEAHANSIALILININMMLLAKGGRFTRGK